jgi:hypothetical protein
MNSPRTGVKLKGRPGNQHGQQKVHNVHPIGRLDDVMKACRPLVEIPVRNKAIAQRTAFQGEFPL